MIKVLREKREIIANVSQTFLRTKQKVIMTTKAWHTEDDLRQDNSTKKNSTSNINPKCVFPSN